MKIGKLLSKDLELPCVILPVERALNPKGKEVLVYSQNRLARGYMEDDTTVVEINIIVEFAIIPELEEFLKDNVSNNLTELYYVQSAFKFQNISF